MKDSIRKLTILSVAVFAVLIPSGSSPGQNCGEAYSCTCGGFLEDDCTPVTANCWYEQFLHRCDKGLQVVDGECWNSTRWQARSGPANDPFEFEGTWAQWALGWQRDVLARGEPINWVMQIGTHNAYNNSAEGLADPNQFYSLSDQLKIGSRVLLLDLHRAPWFNHVRLAHAKSNHLGAAAWDRLFVQAVKEIRYWLDQTGDQILFIDFEEALDGNDDDIDEVLCAIERELGLYLLRESELNAYRRNGDPAEDLVRWPTREELLAQNNRVIIIKTGNELSSRPNDFVLSGKYGFSYRRGHGDAVKSKNFDASTCTCNNQALWDADSIKFNHIYEARSFADLLEPVGHIATFNAPPSTFPPFPRRVDIKDIAKCNPSWLLLDRLLATNSSNQFARLGRAVWSWDVGHGNNNYAGPYVIAHANAAWTELRWRTSTVTGPYRYAASRVRVGNPSTWPDQAGLEWRITTEAGDWNMGEAAVARGPFNHGADGTLLNNKSETFVFGLPVNGPQNAALLDRMRTAQVQDVWLFCMDVTPTPSPNFERPFRDANNNGVHDHWDITVGLSPDINMDAIPDEAQVPVLYVDANCTSCGTGAAPSSPAQSLHAALATADGASGLLEAICVAQGTYVPTLGITGVNEGRNNLFEMHNNVALYGGFPTGFGNYPAGGSVEEIAAAIMNNRDPEAFPTILSGEIGNPSLATDNIRHVVMADADQGVTAFTIFDGFTVRDGYADSQSGFSPSGAAMWLRDVFPTIANCTFLNNHAAEEGGAIYANAQPASEILNCAFIGNTVGPNSNAAGGALRSIRSVSLVDCRFFANTVSGNNQTRGGAVACDQDITLVNSVFSGNLAWEQAQGSDGRGGGVWTGGDACLVNCTFHANEARSETMAGLGGAVFAVNVDIANSIFVGNVSLAEFDIEASGAVVSVTSCYDGSLPQFSDRDLSGDPMLVNPVLPSAGPDGTWGTPDDVYPDLRLQDQSICIDSAEVDPGLLCQNPDLIPRDLDGHPRVMPGPDANPAYTIDMGAYEAFYDEDLDGVPDVVQIAQDPQLDCNRNLRLDGVEIMTGAAPDCDGNGVIDECDILAGTHADCNETGVPDVCEVTAGTSPDVNANGVPDECDPDCNGNGTPDDYDISTGTSPDVNGNGVPDECQIRMYVDPSATGDGSGLTWQNASPELRDTLQIVPLMNGTVTEIWLAEGVYLPTPDSNRNMSFILPRKVGIFGGFPAGGGNGTFGARDPNQFISTLSGDLLGDDLPLQGTAIEFDGIDDRVEVPDTGELNFADQSFSWEFWANHASLNGSNDYILFQGQTIQNHGLTLGFRPNGTFTFAFWSNDLDTPTAYTDTNEWHHWAGTYDAATAARKIYRDGQLVASDNAAANYQGTGSLSLGALPNAHHFHGQMDEVRLWHGVRTEAAIQSNMFQSLTGTEPGLAAYWRFDEGSGTVVADSAGSNDGTLLGGGSWPSSATAAADNSYHVVRSNAGDAFTILDGVVIRGGNADDAAGSNDFGGGMLIIDSSPVISHCVFRGNRALLGAGMVCANGSLPIVADCLFADNLATFSGGGALCLTQSAATFTDCSFIGNAAVDEGGALGVEDSDPLVQGCTFDQNSTRRGAAMYISLGANPTIEDSVFSSGSARQGGGIFVNAASANIARCQFLGNSTTGTGGGGIRLGASSPTIGDCVFSGNSALQGGGILCGGASDPLIYNCLFANNIATWGGGLWSHNSAPTVVDCTIVENTAPSGGGGVLNHDLSAPIYTNCIIWGNTPAQTTTFGAGSPTFGYCDVQGGVPGIGNVNADPQFVDAAGGDYRIDGGSPCIDAGRNDSVPAGVTSDLAGDPRFHDDPGTPDTGASGNGPPEVVDMGAYEFQGTSVFLGDLDCSGTLDPNDIAPFVQALIDPAGYAAAFPACDINRADTNADMLVNGADTQGFIDLLTAP